MASYVAVRKGNTTTTTKYVGGKAVSSTTTYNTSGSKAIAQARMSEKSGSSSSSSSQSSTQKRASELIRAGVESGLASQIANAESKGQRVTNLSPQQAQMVLNADLVLSPSQSVSKSTITSEPLQVLASKVQSTPTQQQKLYSYTGQVQGQIYSGLTQQEVLQNKLLPNSKARILLNQSSLRNEIIDATNRIRKGTETS